MRARHHVTRRQRLTATLLALAAAPALTGTAHAAPFDIDQCATPDGTAVAVTPGFIQTAAMTAANACSTGDGYQLGVADNRISPPDWSQAGWSINAPAGLKIMAFTAVLSVAPRTGDPSPTINAARMFTYDGTQEWGAWTNMAFVPPATSWPGLNRST